MAIDELKKELQGNNEQPTANPVAEDKSEQLQKELEEAKRKTQESESKLKDKDFELEFSKTSSRFQNAKEFEKEIREKVDGGYSVEDATLSVLNKNGKLNSNNSDRTFNSALGGSASVPITPVEKKQPKEMNRDELRAAVMDLERKGEIGLKF